MTKATPKKKPARTMSPAQEAAALRRHVAKLERELAEVREKLTTATSAPKADPVPKSLEQFTEPPSDPLEAQASLYRMLVLSAYDVAKDKFLTSANRRKELRTIIAAAAKLFPESRRWEVDQLIRQDREAIDKRASEKAGATLEQMP